MVGKPSNLAEVGAVYPESLVTVVAFQEKNYLRKSLPERPIKYLQIHLPG